MLPIYQISSTIVFLTISYIFISYQYKNKQLITINSNNEIIKINKQRKLYFSIAFLITIFVIKLGYDISQSPNNLYQELGTGRQSNPLQIRQSYKKVSKLYHPDRNPSSDAQIKFQSIKSAYDILMDESQRVIYNKFGEQSINFDPRLDELKLLSEIAVVFVGWGVLSYIFTSPIGARACRTWVAILALVLLAIEITFTVMDTEIPKISNPLFQYLTEYELVLLSHSIYPLILSVLRVISEHYYVDIDTTLVEILKGIVGTQSAIAQLLNQLQQSLDEYIHNNNNHNTSTEELELKIKELKEVLDLSNNSSNYIINELKKSSNNLGSNYYWIIFVVMYGGIYLLQ